MKSAQVCGISGESGVDQVELDTTENPTYSKPNYDIINRMNYFLFTWE